jgi:hypothetical protein
MNVRAILVQAAITVAMSLMAPAAVLAQAGPSERQPMTDQFFQELKKGDASGAFRSVMKDVIPYLGSGTVDGLSGQTGALISSFGGVIDWSPLATEALTPTFVRETYYVRTKATPLFFTFTFYKPGVSWQVVDVQLGTYYNEKSNGHLVEPATH